MQVTIQTYRGYDGLHPEFHFLRPLIEALGAPLGESSIFFPKTQGGLRESEARCIAEYVDCNAVGTFVFFSKSLELKMAYRARVRLVPSRFVGDSPARLELTMVPGQKMNKKIWPTITTYHTSYAGVVKALTKNFERGSVFRKIISHLAEDKL